MKTHLTNQHSLKVGDTISFLNGMNYKRTKTITRISDKSVWYGNQRESWGTLNGYIKKYNADILRLKTVKSYDGKTDVDIKAFQDSLIQWPSRVIPYLDDDGRAGLLYSTYQPLPCGCEVIGNGTLQFPLSVNQCKLHKNALNLLEELGKAKNIISSMIDESIASEGVKREIRMKRDRIRKVINKASE